MSAVFPFFVGAERSGTTLLRAMFDSHPYLAVPPESHFIVQLHRQHATRQGDGPFPTDWFVESLSSHERFARWELHRASLEHAVVDVRGYSEAVRRVFALYASCRGKRLYGDKTPGYVRHIPLLAGLFPEARFVHIVRDGRDVATSLRQMEFGPDGVVECALRWQDWVAGGKTAGATLGALRYREIGYEDLVADAPSVLRELCVFLDLPFNDQMLGYVNRADSLIGPLLRPDAHQRLREPPTSGVRDWRQDMSPSEVATFELVAGPLLEACGYDLSGSKLGAVERARIRAALRLRRLRESSRPPRQLLRRMTRTRS